jgi:two-component system response regulator HydG
MERAVLLATSDTITDKYVPKADGGVGAPVPSTELPLNLDELERMAVKKALRKSNGNKTEAARILGITRKTLAAKLEKYGDKDS